MPSMFCRTPILIRVGLMLVGISSVSLAIAAKTHETALTPSQAEQLQSLPYSIADQRSLFIRYRHVESVHFYGGGQNSRFSFKRGSSMLPGGLSLRLLNRGQQSWSNGIIRFRDPLDVSRYNSVVLWVRTNHPRLRFWIGVQNPGWRIAETAQARTDILPFRGLPQNEAVQLVVPYSAIFTENTIDYRQLSQVQFEFGQDTAGNQRGGLIEILGLAFVEQRNPPSRVKIVYNRPAAKRTVRRRRRRRSTPRPAAVAPPAPVVPEIQTPEPLADEKPADVGERTAVALLDMTDEQAATVYKSFGLKPVAPPPPLPQVAVEPAAPSRKEWIQNYARFWPNNTPDLVTPTVSDEASRASTWWWLLPGILAIGAGAWVAAITVRRRNRGPFVLGKTLSEINWPFLNAETSPSHRFERDFWRGLGAQNVRCGWLSVAGAAADGPSHSELYGETFLFRQAKLARRAGVRLFPSLSFFHTVFNYETFLANPRIYPIRPVPTIDRHLGDEELRMKEKEAFPVWIPPFWQRKFNLPNRVLLSYGRSGGRVTRERVPFRHDAPELRTAAIRVIERFATVSPGIRIEDAARLLSPAPGDDRDGRSANGHGDTYTPVRVSSSSLREFWTDVISAVKTVYPNFIFIADAGSEDVERLLSAGFDYVENSRVSDELRRHVATGIPGLLPAYLQGPFGRTLPLSIFNLTPFLRSDTDEGHRQPNLLCAALLTLLPGLVEYSDDLPADVAQFIGRIARLSLLRKGRFTLLTTTSPHLLAFARWQRRSVYIAVANLSDQPLDGTARLEPILSGLDDNKLYLFNNPLHGLSGIKSAVKMMAAGPAGAAGPAMALWGENLRSSGLPLKLPALSLRLFSVNLTRPLSTMSPEDAAIPTLTQ